MDTKSLTRFCYENFVYLYWIEREIQLKMDVVLTLMIQPAGALVQQTKVEEMMSELALLNVLQQVEVLVWSYYL